MDQGHPARNIARLKGGAIRGCRQLRYAHDTDVFIAGAGPVGLTRWTNARCDTQLAEPRPCRAPSVK